MYTFLTQFNSPNYTPASEARSVWGRPRTIEAIAIHWYGDPMTNPTFEGVVNYLCRPNGSSSAHFVATGTGRRVACLIDLADASWATLSANPYTISIECDPRCRPEDYDVVGELVAELRATYGNLPLVPHKQFGQTACPGNYDLNRINQVASTKIARAEDQFGQAHDKTAPAPVAPAPQPTPVVPPVAPTPLPTVPDKLDRIGAKVDANNALLTQILELLKGLVATVTRIFK